MSNKIVNNTMKLIKAFGGQINDGLENALTGMGIAGKDKRLGGNYKYKRMPQTALEQFHDSSDIAKIVVNKVPELATKKWLTHKVDEEDGGIDMVNDLVDEDERLDVKCKFEQALQWARLYGGSGIYMSVSDGLDPKEPLNLNRIITINNLTVFHRYELNVHQINSDIDDPNFGMPENYLVSGREMVDMPVVHHSRIIRFEGAPLSQTGFISNSYWHDSVLTILHEVARDYENAYNGVFNALIDFDIDIVKLKDLPDLCAGDDDDLIVKRLKLMQLSKSIMSAVLIDAEDESFEKLQRQFTNIDKVLEKCDKRLTMVTQLPHTILFGEGSTGQLGASGESEQNTLNDLVAGAQGKAFTKPIRRLQKVIQSSRQGPTKGNILKSWSHTYNKLNEPTEKAVAETRKLTAETDKIYLENSVLSAQEVADSRFGGDEYSSETNIDAGAREEQGETNKISAEETEKIMAAIKGMAGINKDPEKE